MNICFLFLPPCHQIQRLESQLNGVWWKKMFSRFLVADGATDLSMGSTHPDRGGKPGRAGGAKHVQHAQVPHELFHQTPRHRRFVPVAILPSQSPSHDHLFFSYRSAPTNLRSKFVYVLFCCDFALLSLLIDDYTLIRFECRPHQRPDGYCLENHRQLACRQHRLQSDPIFPGN